MGPQRQVWMTDAGAVVVCSETCLKLAKLRAELTGQAPETSDPAVPDVDDLPEVEAQAEAELADRGEGDTSKPTTMEVLDVEPGTKPKRKR
ncbi:MAG: hypothetical protein CMLOHMNK_02022 [Steroidobacteraceae bacterium]|nr:hypothetical protein [Steroidobacteraceae bacterium]